VPTARANTQFNSHHVKEPLWYQFLREHDTIAQWSLKLAMLINSECKETTVTARGTLPNMQNSSYGLQRLPQLGNALLQVLIPDEVRNLWKERAWQTEAGRSARTLVKYPDLRIVLVSMKAHTRLKRHKIPGRFAILTLAGHLRVHLANASVEVPTGELLALDRDMSHEVEAIRQSTFLLFIAWPGQSKEAHDA
jgi:quercetin dioxygenase-like cupin family protein